MADDPSAHTASARRSLAFLLDGADATEALAAALAEHLVASDVIALDGDLGAGKTTFVRGLARGLASPGGPPPEVASPTYILMDVHEGGRLPLFHFDAWMEGREKALLEDGGDEWLRAGGVAVVEWASRVAPWLPEERLRVELSHLGPGARRIRLEAPASPRVPPSEGGPRGASDRVGAGEWARRLALFEPSALRCEGVARDDPGSP